MTRYTIFAAFACTSLLAGPVLAADNPIIGAPSPIPHPVANYLPITIDKNNCLMCHREQPADRARQKGEIPRSHYAAPGKLAVNALNACSATQKAHRRSPSLPSTRTTPPRTNGFSLQ